MVMVIKWPEMMAVACSIWPPKGRPQARNPLILPRQGITLLDSATEICRSVDYHLLAYHPSADSIPVLCQLRLSALVLGLSNEIAKLEWVMRILETVANTAGLIIARYLFDPHILGRAAGLPIKNVTRKMSPKVLQVLQTPTACGAHGV